MLRLCSDLKVFDIFTIAVLVLLTWLINRSSWPTRLKPSHEGFVLNSYLNTTTL